MNEPSQSRAGSPPKNDAHWLAVAAVVPIPGTVYQTLVVTEVIDDRIRKCIDAEHYSMIWATVC
jgi:hypothetical protein